MPKHHIFIAGSGGIGRALGLILADQKEIDATIYLGDIAPEAAQAALKDR
jgi:malate/lactate dehydrogenase